MYAFLACLRIRLRARHVGLGEPERHFYETMANALIASMVGFIVGGAFIALALNDLTWLTFALVAALDRLSARDVAAVASEDAPLAVTPLAGPTARADEKPRFTGDYRSQLRETTAPPASSRPGGENGR
jgi:hypothetical protein